MTDDQDRAPARRSIRGLDAINLLMADVRDEVGPYLSVFLKGSQQWDAGAIGLAMGASSIAAALCQIPAGMLVDGSRAKRLLIAASGLTVGLACLLIVLFPKFLTVIAAQVMLGAASALIPPAIAALSLGLVGRRRLDGRISRNEGFNHTGNLMAAVLAGGLGQYLGYDWIFYLVCGFAVASAVAVCLISPRQIDHDVARGEDAWRVADPDPGADATAGPAYLPGFGDAVRFRQCRDASYGGAGGGADASGFRCGCVVRVHHRRAVRHDRRCLGRRPGV